MSRSLLLACLLLPCTLLAEQAGPQPIEMPDIRANIIKMLQEGKHEGMEPGEESYGQVTKPVDAEVTQHEKSDTPASPSVKLPPGEQDLFSVAEEQKNAKGESASAPEKAEPVQKRSAQEQKSEQHLNLPSKEITIQDVDDLKKLMREFEEARKRQQER